MPFQLLVINPGSTSTKFGVFKAETEIFEITLKHSLDELGRYPDINAQLHFRQEEILKTLTEKNFELSSLDAVVARGGLLKPVPGGTFLVNERMLDDLNTGIQGQHASNLGGIIADSISRSLNIPAFIVDPVIVDELEEVARVSGIPEIGRRSIFHALNQKAVARRYAREKGCTYEELSLIVAHLGGGVSVGVHRRGRVVEVNNALDGDGPFSPERSGGVPVGDLVRICFSGKYTLAEMERKLTGLGGISAYLGTNDFRTLSERVEAGDPKAKLICDAFIYQVAREIGSCAPVLNGRIDSIILTGGVVHSQAVVEAITAKVGFLAPVSVYPGEDELLALAEGGLRVLRGEENAKEYN